MMDRQQRQQEINRLLDDLEVSTLKALIEGVERGVPSLISTAAKFAINWPKEMGVDMMQSKSLDLVESLLEGMSCQPVEAKKEKKKKKKAESPNPG